MTYENKIQWFTESEFVDIETGEIITQEKIKKLEYIIIKKTKHATVNNSTGIVKITNQCRRTGQLKLF